MATDEWTVFKSDVAHSASNPSDVLLPPFTLKWSSSSVFGPVGVVSYSSPVMLNGKTYIGSVNGSLYGFNGTVGSSTNAPLWIFKTECWNYFEPTVAKKMNQRIKLPVRKQKIVLNSL